MLSSYLRTTSAVRASTESERDEFRKQEMERYTLKAHKPYIYKAFNEENKTTEETIVGPVKVRISSFGRLTPFFLTPFF